MIIILKPIFEIITESFSVSDNFYLNMIIMAIIAQVSYRSSFGIVGDLYRGEIIDGKISGSLFHWLIRTIIFFLLYVFVNLMIKIVNIVSIIPVWAWVLIPAVILSAFAILSLCKSGRK